MVAEGVEHADQEAFLLRHGCQLAQGYFYARPLSEHELLPVLMAPPVLPARRTTAAG